MANKQDSPRIGGKAKQNWMLYSMVVPGALFFLFFKYIPLLGTVIAFQDYNIYKGIPGSPWVGLKHYVTIFSYYDIYGVIINTFRIGLELILFSFPVPIILALLMNEINSTFVKRSVQSILYLPYFFSWVLIANLVFKFLSVNGPINGILELLGQEKVFLLNRANSFDPIIIISEIWKNSGWGTIVYLAAMAGISPELYESASIDGANRPQKIWHITLPLIVPVIVTLLLLRLGQFLDIGFDFIYQFQNPVNMDISDIVETYNYRAGIVEGKYSLSTALGTCKALVGMVMILAFNRIATKHTEAGGLW